MNVFVSTEWQDYSRGDDYFWFAETSDPRVVAVIQRDNDAQISELYDGDAINPVIYVEHRWGRKFSWVAGYKGDEAEVIQRANEQFDWPIARRYLWIFHGIAAEDASGGYDNDGSWIVVSSPGYHQHIGGTQPATYAEAREDCKPIAKDLCDALDGDVYGIGFATNEGRLLHDDEPIDLSHWDIQIESWGYVGEAYAQREAAAFSCGDPRLSELITNADVFA
jgi:hypothetical protein